LERDLRNAKDLIVKTAYESIPGDPVAANLSWVRAFESRGLPEAERYASWRAADVASLTRRFDTVPDEPFAVEMDWLDLGTIGLGSARITAQDWHRRADNVRRDDNDDLVVSIRHRGAAFCDMNGRDVTAPVGSIVLSDMSQVQGHYSEASFTTGFALPRALAEQILPASVRRLHGHVIPPEQAALLASHVITLRESARHLPASSAPIIARTIFDLFTVSLAASFGEQPADVEQQDRARVVQLRDTIERHLGSPSLNTARLSRIMGVSRSTLYRLMQDQGGVQAYIRARRLARIAESLRDPADRQTIAALAERWGFCDAAYLGRAFREGYGITPGEYRAFHATGRRD
jgi:AraC-like DNA-binding protein